MARSFNGSTDYLEYTGAVVTGPPCTLWAEVYPGDTNTQKSAISIAASGANTFLNLDFDSDAKVYAESQVAGTDAFAGTSATYTANTWHQGAAVFASSTSRTVYLDGGNAVSNTTSSTIAGLDRTAIGRVSRSSPKAYWNGRIGRVAIWSVALSADDIAALWAGAHPCTVRPDAIVAYWENNATITPEPEFIARQEMAITGTSLADGPGWVRAPFAWVFPKSAPQPQTVNAPDVFASWAITAPTAQLGTLTVSAPSVAATWTVPGATAQYGALTVNAPNVAAAWTISPPAVQYGALSVSVSDVSATWAASGATAAGSGGTTVNAPSGAATWAVEEPAVQYGALDVAVPNVGAQWLVDAPTTSGGAQIAVEPSARRRWWWPA